MMQLILIFLCTTFLKFEVVYQSCHSHQTLFWLVPFILIYLLLSNWLRVYWHRPSQHSREHYIIYSTIYFYNVFYSKYLWQQARIDMLGLFVLNLSLSESTIHWLQCAKIFGFWTKLKKLFDTFLPKNHNTYYVSLIKKHYPIFLFYFIISSKQTLNTSCHSFENINSDAICLQGRLPNYPLLLKQTRILNRILLLRKRFLESNEKCYFSIGKFILHTGVFF